MKPLLLIIQREYLTRIKKRSFILLTLLIPFLVAATIIIPYQLSQIKDSDEKRVVLIDETGLYTSHLTSFDQYRFEHTSKDIPGVKKDVAEGEVFGVLVISKSLLTNPESATLYSEKQAPKDLLLYINQTLNVVTKEQQINQFVENNSVDREIIQSIKSIVESKNAISVNTIKWEESGAEKETSTELASVIGMVMTVFMYMFILTYGAMVMQGVIEEKSNRIVEVMISSVRPFDLMMGKIIGIGLTGFTQLLAWLLLSVIGISIFSLSMPSVDASHSVQIMSTLPSLDWGYILVFFLLFFVGGYLIYASLFAMFASAVDNPQDSQQFVMPITLIFIFALYAGIYSTQNPDGPLAFWCSMIPFTSPIVMMVRIPYGIPFWQALLSVSILYASVVLTIKFAAKIYRVGILMYGKKPSIKELYRWMKYK